MSQIQNNALFGATANAANAAANVRKDLAASANANTGGAPAFAQWLSQSSQQLQAKVAMPPMPTAPTVAPKAPAPAPAPQANANANNSQTRTSEAAAQSDAAQEESKAVSRAAERARANAKAGEAAPAQDTDGVEDPRQRLRGTDAAEDDAGLRQARDARRPGADVEETEDTEATATPAQQILALLRGDAPADKPARAVAGEAGDAPADRPERGQPGAAGKHRDAALQERQQLQRELRQAAPADAQAQAASPTAAGHDAAAEVALQAAPGTPERGAGGQNGPAATGSSVHSFEAQLAAAQQAATPGASATPSAGSAERPSVPLAQPLYSPGFAPELSASVSLLIQDGVHEAQLQLNPTDMGPVSINIQVDGQQAQVNFHAEHAATREVLERSLPDLAAALQNQGLTLSGGGVFAQQQGSGREAQRDGAGSNGGDRRLGGSLADDGQAAPVARAEPRSAPRGLVDLYA